MPDGVGCGQHGEDRILALFFGAQSTGLLVDVGAANGYDNSNSIGLLKRPGWRGVLIDPLPEHAAELRTRYAGRDGVFIVDAGIGQREGMTQFHCGGQVSTFDAATRKAAEDVHHIAYRTISVQVRTLTSVLDGAGLAGQCVDFLSIDAEGRNYDVWQALDKAKYMPRLVCIEGHGYSMPGYVELCRCGCNTFYARSDQCLGL